MTISERIHLIRVTNTSTTEEHRADKSEDHDHSGLIRRCIQWRKAFRDVDVAYPATLLTIPLAAKWIRDCGGVVDTRSPQGIMFGLSAGIAPARMHFHCGEARGRAIHDAVGLGVGQFVLDSHTGVAMLAACAERPQRVLVDISPYAEDGVIASVLREDRLTLAGLYSEYDSPEDAVLRLVEQSADIRHSRNVLLCRMALGIRGSHESLESLAESIDDTLEDSCARFRFPRPALTVCPDWAALTV
jgi:hypothetical protein